MRHQDLQEIIDRAVKIATRSAMYGNPVERILWAPPTTASQDWHGAFVVHYAGPQSASILPPWEK